MLAEAGFEPATLAAKLEALTDDQPEGAFEQILKKRRAAFWARQGEEPDIFKESENPFFILQYFHEIELLQDGYQGRRHPARCKICTSRRQPLGRVFNLDKPKSKVVKHFLAQHVLSAQHIQHVRALETPLPEPEQAANQEERRPCEGCDVTGPGCWVAVYSVEIKLWVHYASLDTGFALHDYKWCVRLGRLVVKSRSCDGTATAGTVDGCCKACRSDVFLKSIVRNVVRFAKKWHLARVLKARLFKRQAEVTEVVETLKSSVLYK